jgi:hypothetical protein
MIANLRFYYKEIPGAMYLVPDDGTWNPEPGIQLLFK